MHKNPKNFVLRGKNNQLITIFDSFVLHLLKLKDTVIERVIISNSELVKLNWKLTFRRDSKSLQACMNVLRLEPLFKYKKLKKNLSQLNSQKSYRISKKKKTIFLYTTASKFIVFYFIINLSLSLKDAFGKLIFSTFNMYVYVHIPPNNRLFHTHFHINVDSQ